MDFTSRRVLEAHVKANMHQLDSLIKTMPSFEHQGVTFKPLDIYVWADGKERRPSSASEVDASGYISVIYDVQSGRRDLGDVRIQMNGDTSGYVSGWIDGEGVQGPNVRIKSGIAQTLVGAVIDHNGLMGAIEKARGPVDVMSEVETKEIPNLAEAGVTEAPYQVSNLALPAPPAQREIV